MPVLTPRVVSFETIGCRLNQTDTAIMMDRFAQAGFQIVQCSTPGRSASIHIVNTCAVTSSATRRSRLAAKAVKMADPKAFIVATGCGVEIDYDAWLSDPHVDLVVPSASRFDIPELLRQKLD